MPRYTIEGIEGESFTITVDAANESEARDLAEKVYDNHFATGSDEEQDEELDECYSEGEADHTFITVTPDTMTTPQQRLEYLRGELRAERISTSELIELQALAQHIEPGDVELLEAAGVPEHEETN